MTDKERELFEAHIEKTESRKPLLWKHVFATSLHNPPLPAHLDGVYFTREDQKAWLAWQARAALDAPEAPTVDQAITSLVSALAASKGWMRGYAEAVIRDAIDRKEASAQELSDEAITAVWDAWPRQGITSRSRAVEFARAILAAAAKAQGGSHG